MFEEAKEEESQLDKVEDLVRKKFGKNAINRAEGLSKSREDERWFE
jgi:hypothetical protein